jgi:hypothetical protein
VEGSQQTLGYWRCLTVMVRAASTPTKVSCWRCLPGRRALAVEQAHAFADLVRNAFPANQLWPREVMSWWRGRGAYVADQRCPGREIRALGRRSSSARGWSRRSSP